MTTKEIKNSCVLFLAIFGLFTGTKVYATTYSTESPVRFTFNSELHVDIDSADIEILDLAPGTSSDSNVVGLTISTNNVAGYSASATVGNTTYNTTSMVHNNNTDAFTSIATDSSLSSLTTDNTWGYATSLDDGSSWSNFSGLPIYTENAKLLATTDSPASDAIKFKINAKAATNQSAGDYKNVINFTVVANVPPRDFPDVVPPDIPKDPETGDPIIQEIDYATCNLVEMYDSEFMVTDSRDHKRYTISKLRDDKCWMTQNLDLDLVAGKTYTTTDTDLGWDGRKYNSTSWTSSNGTASGPINEYGQYTDWTFESNGPRALDPGDWYWIGNWMDGGVSTWYSGWDWYEFQRGNDGGKFSRDPYAGNGRHGHLGNYYNWAAATALNNADDYNNSDGFIEQSICPVNWKLPRITTYREKVLGENDFYNLRWKYVGHDQNNDDKEYTAAPLWFIRGGYIDSYGSISEPGVSAYYWSDTMASKSGNRFRAYSIYANHSQTNVLSPQNRSNGSFVRCVIRTPDKYNINYDTNGGIGSINPQKIAYGESAKLYKNQFINDGYVFSGWNTKANGTGVGYGDEDVFFVDQSEPGKTITLYAQWVVDSGQGYTGRSLQAAYEQAYVATPGQFPKDGGGTKHGLYVPHKNAQGLYDGTYFEATSQSDYDGIPANDLRFAIQDINLEIDGQNVCERTTIIGSEAYVLDLRDYKSYWISKLADGKCWMTQNLDLNLSSSKALNHSTSDLGWVSGDPAATWTPNTSTYVGSVPAGFSEYRDSTYGNSEWFHPRSGEVGDVYIFSTFSNLGYTQYNSLNECISGNHSKKECTHYHVGNYYNWAAAVASNNAASVDSTSLAQNYAQANSSICPAGWRLPRGIAGNTSTAQDSSEILQLFLAYNLGTPTYNAYSERIAYSSSVDSILAGPLYFTNAGIVRTNISLNGPNYFYGTHDGSGIGQYFVNAQTAVAGTIQNDRYRSIRCIAR